MIGWRFWVLCLLAAALLAGAGFVAGRMGPEAQLRETTQANLMEGWGLLDEANQALAAHPAAAEVWGNEGIAYIQAAEQGLSDLGVYRAGNFDLYTLLSQAETDVLTNNATPRDREVLLAFHRALAPFRHLGYGDIPDAKLRAALARCVTLLGPGPG